MTLPPKQSGAHQRTGQWRQMLDAAPEGEWIELPLRSAFPRYRHPEYELCQRTIPGRGLVFFGRRVALTDRSSSGEPPPLLHHPGPPGPG